MRTLSNVLVSFALLLLCNSVWCADNKSIQGMATGIDGKPLADAVVQAERLDMKTAPVTTKTDMKGQYTFKGLPVGVYAVTVTVKTVPKSSAKIKTTNKGWVRVDFDLRSSANGGQRSNNATSPMANDDLRRAQQSLGGNINNMSFPGH